MSAGCLIRTKFVCDCINCPEILGTCSRGIGEGEMNTADSPELDSKAESFKFLGGPTFDV